MDEPSDVTRLLNAISDGDETAHDRLVPVIYEQLRAMAGNRMRRERQGHTLQPTELVNEAYLRLVGSGGSWQNRGHFFGAAAEAMRRVLIDHARRRRAGKRGGDRQEVTFADLDVIVPEPDQDVVALDEALTALEQQDPRIAAVVRYRYFGGFGIDETAELLSISPATVKRDWSYARAWLLARMSDN